MLAYRHMTCRINPPNTSHYEKELMSSTLDWISLSLVPGLGLGGFWRLIEYFRSPTAVLAGFSQRVAAG